jgi:hypothetical protein
MDREYWCPTRRRVVLQQGCAYGAPVHLFEFEWPSRPKPATKILDALIMETTAGTELARECEQLHERLLRMVTQPAHIRYTASDESISIDERHVCRGVPARILRHCARAHAASEQTEFSFRELKRDPSLVSHPKNTGFEVRLKRLREALGKLDCGVAIDIADRGTFRFRCERPLRYSEQ